MKPFCCAVAPIALAIEWSVFVLVVDIEEVDRSWFMSSMRKIRVASDLRHDVDLPHSVDLALSTFKCHILDVC